MKLAKSVVVGLAAFVLGCGSVRTTTQKNGFVLPAYDWKRHTVLDKGMFISSHFVSVKEYNTNRDKKVDVAEISIYGGMVISPDEKPLTKVLFVDRDFDGLVDFVVLDTYGKKDEPEADGSFDMLYDAAGAYEGITGEKPTKKNLELEDFVEKYLHSLGE